MGAARAERGRGKRGQNVTMCVLWRLCSGTLASSRSILESFETLCTNRWAGEERIPHSLIVSSVFVLLGVGEVVRCSLHHLAQLHVPSPKSVAQIPLQRSFDAW